MSCASSQERDPGFRRNYVITCKHWTHECYNKAQSRCRNGYGIINESETQRTGGPHGRYREFTLTVGCK